MAEGGQLTQVILDGLRYCAVYCWLPVIGIEEKGLFRENGRHRTWVRCRKHESAMWRCGT